MSSTRVSLLDRMLDPLSRALTPEVARRLNELRADPQIQERIEYLADRCNEGLLTPEERDEYETLVMAGEVIAILRAKAKHLLAQTPAT